MIDTPNELNEEHEYREGSGAISNKGSLIASQRAKEYQRKNRILFVVDFLLGIVILIAILLTGFSGWLRDFCSSYSESWWVIVGLYVLCLGLITTVVSFPLSFYKDFRIEHRFDQSNQKFGQWFREQMKGLLISMVIGLPLIIGLYALVRNFSTSWWLLAALGWLFFTVAMAQLAPILIMPLFNKFEQIKDDIWRERIFSLAQRAGVRIKDVLKMDMSKQTKKANAFFTGIGRTKRIVLGDTLLDNFAPEETDFVLAHEMAHQKFGHIWKTVLVSTVSSVLAFYLGYRIMQNGVNWFEFDGVEDIAGFPLLVLTFTLFFLVLMPLQNALLRRHEREADDFALEMTNDPAAMISTMRKLAEQNLADPDPPALIEFVLHSHPSINKRIARASEYMGASGS